MEELFAQLERWLKEGEEVALATLVRVRGSAPRPAGARLALTRSARMTGSVSGGCVETDVYERALAVLDDRRPVLASYGIADEMAFEVGLSCGGSIDVFIEPFQSDDAWQALRSGVESQQPAVFAVALGPDALAGRRRVIVAGMPAGSIDPEVDRRLDGEVARLLAAGGTAMVTVPQREGEVEVFLEAFLPAPRLLIVGATHAAMPLCRLAHELGFRVTVVDARSIFATRERFPEADQVIRAWPDEAIDQIGLDAYSSVVVLSHDEKFDLPTLRHALRSPARYVGAMGSKGTHERRLARLREEGFLEPDLRRIHAPIGLDVGAQTPEEIALAVLAEIVAVHHGRPGTPLSAGVTAHAGQG